MNTIDLCDLAHVSGGLINPDQFKTDQPTPPFNPFPGGGVGRPSTGPFNPNPGPDFPIPDRGGTLR